MRKEEYSKPGIKSEQIEMGGYGTICDPVVAGDLAPWNCP